jgi:type IV pilus assembly protein PilQ
VRSARNTIRLELEPASGPLPIDPATPIPVRSSTSLGTGDHAASATEPAGSIPSATVIEKVRATHTKTATTVTLFGNGRLNPSALVESEDLPRRLILDFPNVSTKASAQTVVNGVYIKKVRVALNSQDPLVTRVVMEIEPAATYHVERAGPDGRDLAVVFEGPKAAGAVLVAPPDHAASTKPASDDGDTMSMAQAVANAASITPADPIAALDSRSPAGSARQGPPTAATAARQAQPPPAQPPTPPPGPPSPPATSAPAGVQQQFGQTVPGSGQKKYIGPPVSFDFEDADLRSVLRTFAEVSGLNIIIDPNVQGRVNVVLNEIPWDQALDEILRANKLGYTVNGTIIRVAPISVLTDEQKERAALAQQQALAGELRVQTFALSYAKADALSPLLTRSALSQRGQIQTDARTNTLIITDLPDRLQTAEQLIKTLDQPEPQVEVEARIVQTTRDFARAIGIQWGMNGRVNQQIGNTTGLAFPNNGSLSGRVGTQGPTDPRGTNPNDNSSTVVNLAAAGAVNAIGLALGSVNGAFNLDIALTALENSGKGRILSTPRLTTQNNQEAEVAQGIQIPIQTVANNTVSVQFKDAVLVLKVTPQITAANTVIMNVTIENATPDFSRQVNGIPPIDTQRALTRVQVNDGATTVIGGIFVSQEQTTNDRTPALHRIPLLGWLFRRDTLTDSSRELLIFITPRILRG